MDAQQHTEVDPREQMYSHAEMELFEWLDKQITRGLTMTDIVFMLQFRIFDINQQTLLQSQLIHPRGTKVS